MIIYILNFIVLASATILDGLHHGTRTREYNTSEVNLKKKLSNRWHFLSGFAIFLYVTGAYLYCIRIFETFSYIELSPGELLYDYFTLLLVILGLRWCLFNYANNIGQNKEFYYLSDRGTDGFYKRYVMRWFPLEFVFITQILVIIFLIYYFIW